MLSSIFPKKIDRQLASLLLKILNSQAERFSGITIRSCDVKILNLNLFRKPLLLTPASPEVRGSIFSRSYRIFGLAEKLTDKIRLKQHI